MRFHIITLFPGACSSYVDESIIKRAIEDKKISVKFYNPRDFSTDTWGRIDQKPYGGGPGMVIQALPVIKAIEKAVGIKSGAAKKSLPTKGKARTKKRIKIIFLSPRGAQFTNEYAQRAAKKYTDIVLIAGRYEGIDARVKKVFKTEDVSIGPFVLTGGELPAMIIVDCVARQIKGVLGDFSSREETRIASRDVYTRPEIFEYRNKKHRVPKVLLSGNHAKIDEWRQGK